MGYKSKNDHTKQRNEKANYNARHALEIEEYHDTFTKRLKEARKAKNLTQEEVAEILDISLATYRKYEQGTGNRRDVPHFICSLAKIFNVSADYLIGKEDKPHPEYNDVVKTLGLNEKSIQQLQKINTLDDNETKQNHIDFINCFLGNEMCTDLFFQTLHPKLIELNRYIECNSYRDIKNAESDLTYCIKKYITKVVLPTYIQLYCTGKYTSPSVMDYSTALNDDE